MEISQFMGQQEHEAIENPQDKKAGPPREALSLISAYLPLFELLAMSGVCTSLRDAVNKDVLSWLDIVVKSPLNLRLSDEILMKITSKANGRLTTLALMDCAKITDDGLQRVVERNPLINKLYLPGCTGLTPEGVIGAMKTLSEHHHGLKSLMISGIYNINKEHLETLRPYLEKNLSQQEQSGSWPLLFHEHRDVPTFRHDKGYTTIDVEVCPKCDEVRMVFDCPRRTCKRKIGRSMSDCRGCNFCIPRCQECGGCVDDSEEVEEAVCADILCSDCWLQLPKCDFCNKPYCKQHAHNGSCPPGSTGFVCDVCCANFNI
ncbi:F-box protein SKIP28 [Prunus yedoensis var. nudiflora]|uniref:F-box protein SKIP28 n=1 Tax=Prunus yedoensis var. nudiflora TaxID=2094558 RepID=A0A314ZUA2_PRUYE|nr:F-box protein SKIP28 [Prunus yedoensis var. nudiflora]